VVLALPDPELAGKLPEKFRELLCDGGCDHVLGDPMGSMERLFYFPLIDKHDRNRAGRRFASDQSEDLVCTGRVLTETFLDNNRGGDEYPQDGNDPLVDGGCSRTAAELEGARTPIDQVFRPFKDGISQTRCANINGYDPWLDGFGLHESVGLAVAAAFLNPFQLACGAGRRVMLGGNILEVAFKLQQTFFNA